MAFLAYMTVKGAKQGQFKGEGTDPTHIPIVNFQNQVSVPIDPATGAASGKLQHTPIVVTKEWGAASPQFFQAAWNEEILTSVSISFSDKSASGTDTVYFTVALTNAVVVGIRQYVGSAPGLTGDSNALEDISLTYQKIEISDIPGKTSAAGAW
jgi:type VI secretion system secreted protein Hcp